MTHHLMTSVFCRCGLPAREVHYGEPIIEDVLEDGSYPRPPEATVAASGTWERDPLVAELVGESDELAGRPSDEPGVGLVTPVVLHRERSQHNPVVATETHDSVAVATDEVAELVLKTRIASLRFEGASTAHDASSAAADGPVGRDELEVRLNVPEVGVQILHDSSFDIAYVLRFNENIGDGHAPSQTIRRAARH